MPLFLPLDRATSRHCLIYSSHRSEEFREIQLFESISHPNTKLHISLQDPIYPRIAGNSP